MYSKHSALGSRILGIIRNNEFMPSSHSRVFWNKKKQDIGTSLGKICKENVQRQKESRKFCRHRSRSSNYAIFGHFMSFCRGKYSDRKRTCRATVQLIKSFVWYSENRIIVSLKWGWNSYSGIFQKIFLLRNRVNRSHPKTTHVWFNASRRELLHCFNLQTLRMGYYRKVDLFLEWVSILGQILFKPGSKFGVLGSTYPSKK